MPKAENLITIFQGRVSPKHKTVSLQHNKLLKDC